jgi:hypothetical protein
MNELERVRSMAVDTTVPLTNVLLECIRIAMKRDMTELKDWASREIDGYPVDTKLPEYRVLPGGLKALSNNGFRQDILSVPIELFSNIEWYDPSHIEMRQGIQELELMDPSLNYKAEAPESIRAWVQRHIPGSIYVSVYHELMGSSATAILGKIRFGVLRYFDGLVGEDDATSLIAPSDESPAASAIDRPLVATINVGSGANLNLGQEIVSTLNVVSPVQKGDWQSLANYLREQGVDQEDVEELKSILDELASSSTSDTESMSGKQWTEKVSRKLVRGSGKVLLDAASQMLSGALIQYTGLGN